MSRTVFVSASFNGEAQFSADAVVVPQRARPPRLCEFVMCLVVEPEFQEDRLADYQERFNRLWVPKFGCRGAIAIYIWHVLRQARLIDWLIRAFRAFRCGGPL